MGYIKKTEVDTKNRDRIFVLSGINRFGERLKSAMNGISNNELARRSGMSETTIRKYLRGDIYPGIDSAALVAQACGVSLIWLICGVEQKDDAIPRGDMDTTVATDPILTTILQRLPAEQSEALADAIVMHGVSGILTALNGLAAVSDFLQLPPNEREQALRMLELNKKGASETSKVDASQSLASEKKQAG